MREKLCFNIWTLLLSHHGVKQCFHTMDVAASHWATLQMGPAGPTSEKAAKHMKNTAILVAKRCKNWACEHVIRSISVSFLSFFFFSLSGLLLHHAMATKSTRNIEPKNAYYH
jgi:hypothetical protein